MADLGGVALDHGEAQTDAVALQRRDGGGDSRGVFAPRVVLALELLFCLVEQRPVEGASHTEPEIRQAGLQLIGGKLFGALDIDGCDGRALVDDDHQHIALEFKADVLKEPGVEQCLDGQVAALVVKHIAHPQRQVAEHGTRLDPLDALDPDVADGHRIASHRTGAKQHGGERRKAEFHGLGLTGEKSLDVVVKSHQHQGRHGCKANPLTDLHHLRGDRASAETLDQIIHDVPTVQNRHRQQV